MKLSLVTRIFAGYLLVLVLLGGVILFAVLSMSRMQEEVTVAKQGLLPLSIRLNKLSRDLALTNSLLRGGGCEEVLWLMSTLPELKPFDELEGIAATLDTLQEQSTLSGKSLQLLESVRARIGRLLEEKGTFAPVAEVLAREGLALPGDDNRAFYEALAKAFLALAGQVPVDRPDAQLDLLRKALEQTTLALRKSVMGFEASCNLALNNAWGETREREGKAVRVAFALGVAAFLVTVAVFFLFIVWLKPLGQLRTFAQRISQGDYGQPVPIRSGGEVGELADELNKMAQRLKEREEMIRRQAGELLRADRFSTIGKMATQIAHEIRNPLNALGLKLELLEDSIEEARTPLEAATYEKLRREFEAAGKEIDRLREITDYYLKFAKFPKVEKENVDVSVVLFDLVAFYEDEAQRKGVRVERELERPLWASLDPNLLRHAVANLLRNAIDAACEAQEGAGKVWVKAWKENQELRIVVKDNGPGIPAESLLRVFEPFYSTKKSGTGLGLTLVQQVVTEHGGQVVCSSAPNEGASFRISIPA